MTFTTNPYSFFDNPFHVNGEPSRPSSSNHTETTSPSSTGDLVRTPSNHLVQFPTLAEIMNGGLGNGADNKTTLEDDQNALPSTFLSSYYADRRSKELQSPNIKVGSQFGSPAVNGDTRSSSLDLTTPWAQEDTHDSGSCAERRKEDLLPGVVEMSAFEPNREKTSSAGIWTDLGHPTLHAVPISIDTKNTSGPFGKVDEEAFLSFLENGLDKRKSDTETDLSSDPFAAFQPRLPTPNPSSSSPSRPTTSNSQLQSDSLKFWDDPKYPLPPFGSTTSPIVPPTTQVPINTLSPQSLHFPPHSTPAPSTDLSFGAMPAPYSSTSTSPLRLPSILPPLPSSQSPYHRYHDPLSLHDPRPASAGYPVSLFGNVPLPEMENNWQGGGGSHSMGLGGGEAQMSGADYAQAVALYEHILAAMSHVQPSSASSSSTDGIPFDSLLQMSDQGVDLLSGTETSLPLHRSPSSGRPPSPGSSKPKSPVKSSSAQGRKSGGNDKGKVTKCLGCGSTSTPEWRRGPLGPRTLCNACGLVHMKLQRKKRKAEEKAAAAEAAMQAAQGQGSSRL